MKPAWKTNNSTKTSHFERLSEDLDQFIEFNKLTPIEIQARNDVLLNLRKALPNAIIYAYGSFPINMSLYFSDIDIAVETLHLKRIETRIQFFASATYIQAKVPILQCVDRKTHLEFDVSNGGFNVKKDVRTFQNLPELHRKLILVIKIFLKNRNLHKPHTGGCSSRILIELVAAFFDFCSPKSTNFCVILASFFEFFGLKFNSNDIEIVDGKIRKRKMYSGSQLSVIIEGRDIGSAVYNFLTIRRAFELAWLLINRKGVEIEDIFKIEDLSGRELVYRFYGVEWGNSSDDQDNYLNEQENSGKQAVQKTDEQ